MSPIKRYLRFKTRARVTSGFPFRWSDPLRVHELLLTCTQAQLNVLHWGKGHLDPLKADAKAQLEVKSLEATEANVMTAFPETS